MATTIIPLTDCTFGPSIQIVMMQDHYAVLANGYVVGTIERSLGPGNDGKWALHFLDGSQGLSYVPLYHAMQEAMKWRQPR